MPSPPYAHPGAPDSRRTDRLPFAGARAVAAWWVVLSHSADWLFSITPELSILAPLAHTGLAVDFLFILSGFSIARAHLDHRWTRRSYGRYLRSRFARLYPPHVAVLLAFLALSLGGSAVGIEADDGAFTPTGFLAELTLTRVWFGDALWWNAPAWSLSAQALAFAAFPLIARLLSGRLRTPAFATLIAITAMTIGSAAATVAPSAMNGMASPIIRVMCGFTIGVCVSIATSRLRPQGAGVWIASGGLAGLLAAALWLAPGGPRAAAALSMGAIVIAGLAIATPRSTRLLSSRPARLAGSLAFSTYLVHLFVLIVLAKVVTPSMVEGAALPARLSVVALWIGSITLAAWFLHVLVEVPMHRRLAPRPTGAEPHSRPWRLDRTA